LIKRCRDRPKRCPQTGKRCFTNRGGSLVRPASHGVRLGVTRSPRENLTANRAANGGSARRRLGVPTSHIFHRRRPLVPSFFPNRQRWGRE
jgi:hypothetical protein